MQQGNISIHAQNIMPIIKRWLYSDKDIFVREMVSNGCDAITKQKMLHPGEEEDYRVTVTLDPEAGEIRFTDNGIGMTAEEVEKYINQVAFSGAEEFLKNYEGDEKTGIIGHFGLGFYSAFMVSDKVTIQTLSGTDGATSVKWESVDGMSFSMDEGERTQRGTDVILHIAESEKEFLDAHRLHEILHHYCGFMNTPVYFDDGQPEESPETDGEEKTEADDSGEISTPKAPELINATEALWLRKPKDCTDEEYRKFYHEVFHSYEDPLFYVHLNVDYPFNLKGILYFPKITEDFGTREGEIKLFSGQVFVADNIKEVIPEFLMLLKGVIDCPDLPLNVSRSFLQNDGYVKKLSAYITKKVADKLNGLFGTERENYQKYWDDIHPFVKYGCLKDNKFFDQIKAVILLKTTAGDYLTLDEYFAKNESKLNGKKIVYTNDPTRQSANIAMYQAEQIDVVIMDALIDLNFMNFMEYSAGIEGLSFIRVDADSAAFTQESTGEEKAQHEEKAKALSELFKKATGRDDIQVEMKSLKDASIPVLLTQEEQGRRFGEMSRIYGQSSFRLPEMYTLVLNAANPLIESLFSSEDVEKKELMAAQLFDLARMSTRPLEKEEITEFLNRSNRILEMLAQK